LPSAYHERALDDFLQQVETRALRMAQVALQHDQDALDVVQDSMLGWLQRYVDKPQAQWRPLFYRVLQSRIQDRFRQRKRQARWAWLPGFGQGEATPTSPDELAETSPRHSPNQALQQRQALHALEDALRALPSGQQQAVMLRLWECFSTRDAAIAMQCSEGTVKTQYSRALTALRQHLGEHWP